MAEIPDREPCQYRLLREYVAQAIGVCGGRPTFKHTPIEVASTLDRVDTGEDIDEIIHG